MKSWRLVVRVDVAPCCDQHFGRNCTKKISSSSLMVGFCHLTDSHHNHHGQKPTMVGTCHGGNMLGNHDDDIEGEKKIDDYVEVPSSYPCIEE